MSRVWLATILLLPVPLALAQSIEVAACDTCKQQPLEQKKPRHILIKVSCALEDNQILSQQVIEVDASLSPEEKRAMAEHACQPILQAATAKCEELATQLEALKNEWRVASLNSYHEHHLAMEIKKTIKSAPPYCK